ncbi:hypothetical protein DL96DRAFT_1227345 [Flagelloscypha sp. PMI_526]|nr:hypothetical protein DL96DRAFT_1227345 [Flagelloscypha sp. PMI_526]
MPSQTSSEASGPSSSTWNFYHSVNVIAHSKESDCTICNSYITHLSSAYALARDIPSFQSAVADQATALVSRPTTLHNVRQHPRMTQTAATNSVFHIPDFFLSDPIPEATRPEILKDEHTPRPTTPVSSLTPAHNHRVQLQSNLTQHTRITSTSTQHNAHQIQSAATHRLVYPQQEPQTTTSPASPTPKPALSQLRPVNSTPMNVCPTAPLLSKIASYRFPQSECELLSLIDAAHIPGNDSAIRTIKRYCTLAHKITKDKRTEIQNMALRLWRKEGGSPNGSGKPLINPTSSSSLDEWYAWLSQWPQSWPRGVRCDAQNHPLKEDLRTWRFCAGIRPDDKKNRTSAENVPHRKEFEDIFFELFAQPGRYETMLQERGFSVAEKIGMVVYEGPYPCTEESVCRHLSKCGVGRRLANEVLGPYAKRCLTERREREAKVG